MHTNETPDPHGRDVRRAILPEVLDAGDVTLALGYKSRSAGRRAILRGDCGPFVRQGRKLLVLRTDFLRALEERREHPTPEPTPEPPDWARKILARHRRKGGR